MAEPAEPEPTAPLRPVLVAHERPAAPRFLAVRTEARWPAVPEPGARIMLSEAVRRALDVASGDEVAVLPVTA